MGDLFGSRIIYPGKLGAGRERKGSWKPLGELRGRSVQAEPIAPQGHFPVPGAEVLGSLHSQRKSGAGADHLTGHASPWDDCKGRLSSTAGKEDETNVEDSSVHLWHREEQGQEENGPLSCSSSLNTDTKAPARQGPCEVSAQAESHSSASLPCSVGD